MHNPLKCIFPIVFFMGIAASTAQAQDANCNCGEIVKQLQEENARLRGELHQAQTDNKRRSANAQELEDELKKLLDNKTNATKDEPPTNSKRLSPEEVKESLIQMQKKANKCGHNGNLTVSFGIDETGKVINLNAISGSFNNTPVGQCILDVIQKHRFPEREQQTNGIKYNFILK